ncbi:YncE family protein [Thaumasiovibrio subtropicus]|uniref:YncE family protein n=1 Tax=Thaumasiovibrio subtropicus TaxID=1891207 RepID=UPI000B356784|nr:hypothetical protein [Thaumasiovibrio subtropicus]
MKNSVFGLLAIFLIGCNSSSNKSTAPPELPEVPQPKPPSIAVTSDDVASVWHPGVKDPKSYLHYQINHWENSTEQGPFITLTAISDNSFISDITHSQSDTNGTWTFAMLPGYELEHGSHDTRYELKACYDETCSQELLNSPIEIKVDYRVDLDYEIAVKPEINFSQLWGRNEDNFSITPTVFAEISGSYTNNLYGQLVVENSAVNEHIKLAHVSVGWSSSLAVYGNKPKELSFDIFPGDIKVEICFDESCKYPLKNSPLTFPFNITHQDKHTAPDKALPLTALNLNMLSTEPTDVIIEGSYVYFLSNLPSPKLQVFDLNAQPIIQLDLPHAVEKTDVTVAESGISIAMTHENGILVYQLDSNTLALLDTKHIEVPFTISAMAQTEQYLWAISTNSQQVALIALDTGIISYPITSSHPLLDVSVNPDGKFLTLLEKNESTGTLTVYDVSSATEPTRLGVNYVNNSECTQTLRWLTIDTFALDCRYTYQLQTESYRPLDYLGDIEKMQIQSIHYAQSLRDINTAENSLLVTDDNRYASVRYVNPETFNNDTIYTLNTLADSGESVQVFPVAATERPDSSLLIFGYRFDNEQKVYGFYQAHVDPIP